MIPPPLLHPSGKKIFVAPDTLKLFNKNILKNNCLFYYDVIVDVITFLRQESDPTIPDKIFETKWSNSVKLDRKRNVWYLFLCVFLTAIGKV